MWLVMYMFRKILFPTDFSEGFIRAIKRFSQQNKIEVNECILLHVIDEDYLEELMNGYSLLYVSEKKEYEDIVNELKEKAMKRLSEETERCRELIHPKNIKTLVRIGKPFEEIVKVADEEDVSLILLPSHGKLGFSHQLFGSTTMRVLKQTKKPVLIIKTHE